jgi:hypothetical protein
LDDPPVGVVKGGTLAGIERAIELSVLHSWTTRSVQRMALSVSGLF